jgi:hypothetical protein
MRIAWPLLLAAACADTTPPPQPPPPVKVVEIPPAPPPPPAVVVDAAAPEAQAASIEPPVLPEIEAKLVKPGTYEATVYVRAAEKCPECPAHKICEACELKATVALAREGAGVTVATRVELVTGARYRLTFEMDRGAQVIASARRITLADLRSGSQTFEAFVARVHPCAPCPLGALCKPCEPSLVISLKRATMRAEEALGEDEAWVSLTQVQMPAAGRRYQMTVIFGANRSELVSYR